MLTRDWPTDKNQLDHMLRACRYFFTWDSVSQTNVDAVACGATPIMMHERQLARPESGRGVLPKIRLEDL